MRHILRYNPAIQKALGCKTKPEPWMHIGIKTWSKRLQVSGYAIWIWDTRKVLESNFSIRDDRYDAKLAAATKFGHRADDNKQPLVGNTSTGIQTGPGKAMPGLDNINTVMDFYAPPVHLRTNK